MDLTAHLAELPGRLHAEGQRVKVLATLVRAAHETLDPLRVAQWLVGRLDAWLPFETWAVLEDDLMGPPRMLAATDASLMSTAILTSVASRVIRLGEELVTANLQDHLVSAPAVAAMGLPLVARGTVIGAAVGLADRPAATAPVYEGAPRTALGLLLEPAAVALDNARRMAQAEALSVTDDLTRLYNARYLKQALTREVKRVVRSGQGLSLIFLDLDGFKVGQRSVRPPMRQPHAGRVRPHTAWVRPRDRPAGPLRRRRVRADSARHPFGGRHARRRAHPGARRLAPVPRRRRSGGAVDDLARYRHARGPAVGDRPAAAGRSGDVLGEGTRQERRPAGPRHGRRVMDDVTRPPAAVRQGVFA